MYYRAADTIAEIGGSGRWQTVKSILQQCYGDKSAVTDELVADILQPGLLPGAAAVFLDFVTYSSGPLPEDLLAKVQTICMHWFIVYWLLAIAPA